MSRRAMQAISPSEAVVVSRNEFLHPNFDPQKYVQQKFLSQRVDQVKDVHAALQSEKNVVADEMKTSVYRHYPNFINASKEISNLESNMQEMRNLLTDFNSQIKALQNHQVALRPSEDSQSKLRNFSTSIDKTKISVDTVKDIQWLLELPQRLDIAIALRHFETAVILIESVTQHTREMSELFVNNETKLQVDRRVQQLVNILLTDLQNIYTKSSDSRKIIGYLMRLDKARETFLDTKSKKLEAEIKKLKLEGDLTLYISDLAQLVFSSVNSTCEEYRTAFISPSMDNNNRENSELSSGFIVWAVQELEKFGSIFRNQVFNNAPDDFTAIGKCLEIAMLYCDLLEKKGLSLSFVLSQMFYPNLIDSIQNYYLKIQATVTKILSTEDWKATPLNEDEWDFRQSENITTVVSSNRGLADVPETKRPIRNLYVTAGHKEKPPKASKASQNTSTVMLTESAKSLYTYSIQFVNNVCKVITLELVPCVGFVLSTLFEDYILQLSTVIKTSDNLTDQQCVNIIVNSKYISEELIPKISSQIQKELNRELKDFDKLCKNTQILHGKLIDIFCSKRSTTLFEKVLEWNKVDYSQPIVNENTTPNSRIVKTFVALNALKSVITSSNSSKAAAPLLASIVNDIINKMTSNQFWEKRKIDEGGLQQLVLDLRFFVECSGDYATENSIKKLQTHMNNCVKVVAKEAAMDDPKEALKPEEWFASKIKQFLSKNAKDMGIRILS